MKRDVKKPSRVLHWLVIQLQFKHYLSNLALKIITYCVTMLTVYQQLALKFCPRLQVLNSYFSDGNDLVIG